MRATTQEWVLKYVGRSQLVQGCMTISSVDEFAFVDSKMDCFVYLDILNQNINKNVMTLGLRKIVGIFSARQ